MLIELEKRNQLQMGININTLQFIFNVKDKTNFNFKDLKVCLLGNLYMRSCTMQLQSEMGFHEKTALKFFEKLGAVVTCIDINGKDGAEIIDLSKPIDKYINEFDLIINGGTCEHVNDQYICFKNIHDMCNRHSIIIHVAPEIGSWLSHCNHHYNQQFFVELANENKYEILDSFRYMKLINESPKGILLTYAYKNYKYNDFIDRDTFYSFFQKNKVLSHCGMATHRRDVSGTISDCVRKPRI